MTSSSFTIEAGHGPNPPAQAASYSSSSISNSNNIPFPSSAHSVSTTTGGSNSSGNGSGSNNNNHINPNNPSKITNTATKAGARPLGHENNIFHAHRQNHNSSKLPAFRFADLKKDALVLPSLRQHMPPSPVSPNPVQNTSDNSNDESLQGAHDQNQRIPGSLPDTLRPQNQHPAQHQDQDQQHPGNRNNGHTTVDKSASLETPPSATQFSHHTKSHIQSQIVRTSTIPARSATTPSHPSTGSKRPASYPDSPRAVRNSNSIASQSSSAATPVAKRRLTTSGAAEDAEILTSIDSASALKSSRPRATETNDPVENPTKEWAQGQRELLLPRTVDSSKFDEKKRSRPPVSYRAPNITSAAGGGRPVIPPIRAFRTSGQRKSLVLDMHTRRMSDESFTEDVTDPNQRDRTLRALEGREDDYSQVTPPDSADATTDNENTAEIFMNIAREESAHPQTEERGLREDQSAISRLTRASHRRPLSTAAPTYQASSPPQIVRRLSDQRENSRSRKLPDVQSAQKIARELAYPRHATTNTEEPSRTQSLRTPLRPSPITPRHNAFQDAPSDGSSIYARRRSSVTESHVSNSTSRISQYRNANLAAGQGRTYNSSPLVPKSVDVQRHEAQQHSNADANHGVEGTESSASTAAPSTVWDELDDLKSRIHRLELTGKIPPTSGAAMSRASDDRPPTATTNATTMSASPKRGSGPGAAPVDAISTTSSQRESQPILISALSKTKNLVSPDVFNAIESAATDALALSNMMGAPGHPGPISSGASTVGGGVGMSITDRQLRRKADSICRSLTELCIALADETASGQTKQPQPQLPQPTREAELREMEALRSPNSRPTAPSNPKRAVVLTEPTPPKLLPTTSPRAPTSLEQRRMTMLATSNLSSPRYTASPLTLTPLESSSAGRKSSMFLRTFRAGTGTEEPEETTGRRSSLILRKRRAVTEEPEEMPQEGRKTSLLRTRRAMQDDEDDSMRLRTPSRAVTEVNGFRAASRDVSTMGQTSPPDSAALGSSPLPRSRLISSSFNPRLPTTPTSSGLMQRRFLGRTPVVVDRENGNTVAEKLADERGQRQYSLGQTAMLNRTSSIATQRRRESGLPSFPNLQQQQQSTQQGGGSYR